MHVERSEVIETLRNCHIFKNISEQGLEAIADRVKAYLYAEGQFVYQQDELADGFFFILSGRVRVTKRSRSREDQAILEAPNYFGEESLAKRPIARRLSAAAIVPTVLLCIKDGDLADIRKTYPVLDAPLKMVLSSHLLMSQIRLNWRAPREVVNFISRRHPVFLLIRLLPVILFGSVFIPLTTYLAVVVAPESLIPTLLLYLILAVTLLWLVWSVIDWTNDYAIITNRRVIMLVKVLLIYDSRQEVPLEAVLAQDLKTSQLGRLMGYGDVVVRTYTGEIILNWLANPQLIINLLLEMRERASKTKKQDQRQAFERIMREKIGHESLDSMPEDAPEVTPSIQPGILQTWLSSLFLLREQSGDKITYRTHWFILLKKTWMPGTLLLLTGLFALLIFLKIIPGSTTLGVIALAGVAPVLLLWLLYNYIDWRNDRYVITPELIVDLYRKPLGFEQRKSAPLRNILSIDYERKGFIGLVLNFGTVSIKVGDTTFTFDNVLNPADVQREIFEQFMRYKQREERRIEQQQRDQLVDYFEIYDEIKNKHQERENPPEED